MGIGEVYYKIEGLEVVAFEVLDVTKTKIKFINKSNGKVKSFVKAYFETVFSSSRMVQLRSLQFDMEEARAKIAEELNEYELKLIMEKYKNYESIFKNNNTKRGS